MESTSNRYKPYSRPSVPRHQRQAQRQRQDEQLNNIPKVITRFMKKSLSWLGIINHQSDEESDTEENESGQPSGSSNLSTATASTAQSSETIKTIYPSNQLKDHVGQSRSAAQNHLNGPFNKGSQSEANRGQRRSGLLGSLTSTGETGDMVEVQDFDVQLTLPIDDSKEGESACSVPSNESQETAKENQTITLPRVEKREHHSDEEFTSDELSLMERLRKITSEHMEMTKGPRKSHDVSKIFKSSLPILIPAAAAAVYKYTHRDDDDDDDDAPMQTPRSSGVSAFVKKELKRARKQIAAHQDSTDMDMDSQDSGLDADESEHGWGNSTGRSRLANRSRREIPNGSPERKRRTIRMDYEADNRSHGKEPLAKTQEAPRRHARFIPGRFSALDTDEEEEDLRRMDLEREQRDSERQHSSAVMVSKETMTDDYLLGSDFTGFSVPPHGRKVIWHDPKVDEALKWTRSPDSTPLISETWLCEKCGFRTNVVASRCEFCLLPKSGARPSGLTPASKSSTEQETQVSISTSTASAITAAPAIISPPKIDLSTPSVLKTTLAEAPVITAKSAEIEALKPAAPSGWAASGFKAPDNSSKWKCPTCDVMNDNKDDICPCCETGKPGAKKAAAPPVLPSIFGAPPAMALSTPEKKPEMPSLFGTPKTDAPALFGAPKTDATALFGAPKIGAPALFGVAKGDAPVSLFGVSTASSATAVKPAMDKSDANKPAAPAAFNFSGAGFKPADTSSKWKCPTCDVMSNDKDDKCPCCETDKPGTVKKVTATLALPSLFGGSTFGSVSSEAEKKEAPKVHSLFQGPPAAASAAESKPAAPATFNFASAGFKPADSSNKWKCPTCDVMNNEKDDKCPCCETEKPGAAKAGKPVLALPSLFGGAPVTPSSAPASKPLFGAASAENSAPSLFGASASSTAGTSLFGAKVPASPSSSLFGGSSAPSTPKLQFGTPVASAGPTTSSAVAPVVSASTAPSLFGASAPAAEAAGAAVSSPATASLFGAASTAMSAPTSTSLFGTPSASAPKSLFSAPPSSALTPTSTPLFGASTLAVTSAPASSSLFGSSTTATSAPMTAPSLFGSVTAATTPATPTAAPLFGSTTSTSTPGSAAPSLFGATSAPAASVSATTSLFGATPAASSASSLFGTPASKAPTSAPLFGASSSSSANPFAAATSAPTSTGATSVNPPLFTFGAPSTSAPAPSSAAGTTTSTAPMSLFGSSTSSTTPAPAFGSTPSFTFGQPTSKNETPSFSFGGSSTASGMGAGSTAPAFGGFGGSTSSSTSGTGFTFGANSTSAPPAGAPSFSFGGSSTAPVTFGANSGNTPSLFGSTGPAFGSSTSSSGGFGQSLTTGSGMNSTSAGSGAQNSMMMSPMMSSSTPTGSGFGGFGSVGGVGPSAPAFGSAPGAPQASPFGQPSSGNSSGMFGFGSAGGSGGPGFGGFGASNAPATGPSSGGFGQPAFGSQQQPAPGFGGFGAGAPPGAPPGAGGESLGGNFSFNIGSAPQADFPAGRKIAKMRKTTKKKP
ncbi:hypothetical protein BGW38_000495 [Lunasporangiospora selenospora]|uniref:RanBP2-type domain-containing protein n=1 Tax=Lunasporangiospora selenospora TaxID=979761 RepID=A0A9P6FWZ5_9FUNG|nr:hypothetical protein BGW38_000495 [Lunasporangiospora selenospora]